jgi:hypothetical protein
MSATHHVTQHINTSTHQLINTILFTHEDINTSTQSSTHQHTTSQRINTSKYQHNSHQDINNASNASRHSTHQHINTDINTSTRHTNSTTHHSPINASTYQSINLSTQSTHQRINISTINTIIFSTCMRSAIFLFKGTAFVIGGKYVVIDKRSNAYQHTNIPQHINTVPETMLTFLGRDFF